MVRWALSVSVFLLGLAPLAAAEGPKEPPAKEAAKEQGTFEKSVSAATIDFAADLGLGFPTLTKLGGRIEAARRHGDPVGLSLAASELAAAEKVSGKKAALTAEALSKEAVALAELRGKSRELAAVALLVNSPDTQKKLTALAKKAAREEAEDATAIKLGDKPRGIERHLTVQNFSPHEYHIFVNGNPVGEVRPRRTERFHVHTHGNTMLMARGRGGKWLMPVAGRVENYTWTLIR
jgi:hypothetical protein